MRFEEGSDRHKDFEEDASQSPDVTRVLVLEIRSIEQVFGSLVGEPSLRRDISHHSGRKNLGVQEVNGEGSEIDWALVFDQNVTRMKSQVRLQQVAVEFPYSLDQIPEYEEFLAIGERSIETTVLLVHWLIESCSEWVGIRGTQQSVERVDVLVVSGLGGEAVLRDKQINWAVEGLN